MAESDTDVVNDARVETYEELWDARVRANISQHETDARRFLDALRARYDDRAWRDLIQPVNDDLRRNRRDALIARVLHQFSHGNAQQRKIDTAEKLYEHLLVDVSSDPCFPTSRA